MQKRPKIGIIISTTRPGRFADIPTNWLFNIAKERNDADFEIVELRDYPMPIFEENVPLHVAPPQNEVALRWGEKIASLDGYIFVTAEYNRGVPAVLKNAIDYSYPEWNRKAAAYVGYGSVGAARSIESLRLICVELQMAPTRTGVHIQGADFMAVWQQGKDIKELTYLEQNAKTMLDELLWWANALKAARSA